MSDTVTDTIACIGKICLYNHKISISIEICPILSDIIACVGKNLPINTMVISGVKKELACLTKSL